MTIHIHRSQRGATIEWQPGETRRATYRAGVINSVSNGVPNSPTALLRGSRYTDYYRIMDSARNGVRVAEIGKYWVSKEPQIRWLSVLGLIEPIERIWTLTARGHEVLADVEKVR